LIALALASALAIATRTGLRADAALVLRACVLASGTLFRRLRRSTVTFAARAKTIPSERCSCRQQSGGHDDCECIQLHIVAFFILFSATTMSPFHQQWTTVS
jgi:hypothetical protein